MLEQNGITSVKRKDPTLLDNYCPIYKLSVLAKILKSLISEQLKVFLTYNSILSSFKSACRKKHSTITVATKVIISAVDCKYSCAAFFTDLSRAFDIVAHDIKSCG